MNLGHAHETRFWNLLGVFSKFSDEHPHQFYRRVLPTGSSYKIISNTRLKLNMIDMLFFRKAFLPQKNVSIVQWDYLYCVFGLKYTTHIP